MTTGIKEIDEYLETIVSVEQYDSVEDLIKSAVIEDVDDQFIELVEEKIGYVDLEKGYKEVTVVLHLVKIDKYIRLEYKRIPDEYRDIEFVKQVFPYPKKTIKYL